MCKLRPLMFDFQHGFTRRKQAELLHTYSYACNKGIWPCWALIFGERPTRRAYAVAQPTVSELCGGTASDQTMPNHSLMDLGHVQNMSNLCALHMSLGRCENVWSITGPQHLHSLDQILRGRCTKPMKLPHKTVLSKIHSANPLVLSAFNSLPVQQQVESLCQNSHPNAGAAS